MFQGVGGSRGSDLVSRGGSRGSGSRGSDLVSRGVPGGQGGSRGSGGFQGVRPSVRRDKVLVFRGVDVTLQMFHPPTLVRSRL